MVMVILVLHFEEIDIATGCEVHVVAWRFEHRWVREKEAHTHGGGKEHTARAFQCTL